MFNWLFYKFSRSININLPELPEEIWKVIIKKSDNYQNIRLVNKCFNKLSDNVLTTHGSLLKISADMILNFCSVHNSCEYWLFGNICYLEEKLYVNELIHVRKDSATNGFGFTHYTGNLKFSMKNNIYLGPIFSESMIKESLLSYTYIQENIISIPDNPICLPTPEILNFIVNKTLEKHYIQDKRFKINSVKRSLQWYYAKLPAICKAEYSQYCDTQLSKFDICQDVTFINRTHSSGDSNATPVSFYNQ
jgi:hypothetical protein